MEITDDLKRAFQKTFDNKHVHETVKELIDTQIIRIIHKTTEMFYIERLSDYSPRVRCANPDVNKQIAQYRPGVVQDVTCINAFNDEGIIVFYIFTSSISKRRNSGCFGGKYYECNLAIYECELPSLDAQLYFPYYINGRTRD